MRVTDYPPLANRHDYDVAVWSMSFAVVARHAKYLASKTIYSKPVIWKEHGYWWSSAMVLGFRE